GLSVVVTVYNEASTVSELYRRAVAALEADGRSFELIFVDDGSTDGSFAELERLRPNDDRVRAVRFKRNFGQHPAMHAGLVRARAPPPGASCVEVYVAHSPREGRSRYSPLALARLTLHLLAGFWPQPIQWVGVTLGAGCTLLAAGLGAYGIAFLIEESNFPGP